MPRLAYDEMRFNKASWLRVQYWHLHPIRSRRDFRCPRDSPSGRGHGDVHTCAHRSPTTGPQRINRGSIWDRLAADVGGNTIRPRPRTLQSHRILADNPLSIVFNARCAIGNRSDPVIEQLVSTRNVNATGVRSSILGCFVLTPIRRIWRWFVHGLGAASARTEKTRSSTGSGAG